MHAVLTVAQALRTPGIAPVDARVLLQHVLGTSHAALAARPERVLTDSERERFLALATRRGTGEPVAYLVGHREFRGRRFEVAPAVLVPRPDTELLVELALARWPAAAVPRVADLGTGSGNVAITLSLEHPGARVIGVERDAAALAVAVRNARLLAAEGVRFVRADWLAPFAPAAFDLIVGNPPYVAAGDPDLDPGVAAYEPHRALLSGVDGLDDIRRIAAQARDRLAPGGWLLLEHGMRQGTAVRALLAAAGFAGAFTERDLAGLERVSGARRID